MQRGRRRRRVGSRRDCVWTFLNFAPSAEGGVHDSGLKNQGKTANVTATPKKNRLRRQGFSSDGSKMRHVARRRCGCGSENAPQISLVPAKQRVSAVGRSDWEPCPVEKKLDLELTAPTAREQKNRWRPFSRAATRAYGRRGSAAAIAAGSAAAAAKHASSARVAHTWQQCREGGESTRSARPAGRLRQAAAARGDHVGTRARTCTEICG